MIFSLLILMAGMMLVGYSHFIETKDDFSKHGLMMIGLFLIVAASFGAGYYNGKVDLKAKMELTDES